MRPAPNVQPTEINHGIWNVQEVSLFLQYEVEARVELPTRAAGHPLRYVAFNAARAEINLQTFLTHYENQLPLSCGSNV
jgi:hypothetical protein